MYGFLILFISSICTLNAIESFNVKLRDRITGESGSVEIRERIQKWVPSETAVIVCDMWDSHHCYNAVKRAKEISPNIDKLIHEVRARGGTIIHSPSSCVDFYKSNPARVRAKNAPAANNLPDGISAWMHWISKEEEAAGYPIDHSDGGEDDDPDEHKEWVRKLQSMGRNPRSPWKRQIDLIKIDNDRDYITDSGVENWNILESKKIKNVMVLGVHTNMCVLGRPFGLRQLAKNNKNVVLVRDLTDTMYNPKMPPFVSHFAGTDLIVRHIEKYVCPTISSDEIVGESFAKFQSDDRPKILFLIGEKEYLTRLTLPAYAEKNLTAKYRLEFRFAKDGQNDFGDLNSALNEADLLFISVRRRALPSEQLRAVREYIMASNPVIGIRTSSHAFSLRNQKPEQGHEAWEMFDPEVFGGNYHGHHGSDKKTFAKSVDAAHPIMKGVTVDEFPTGGSLYQVLPLEKNTHVLMSGRAVGINENQPVAWAYENKFGGKSFYTSLGHKNDFSNLNFIKMIDNALSWALHKDAKKKNKKIKISSSLPEPSAGYPIKSPIEGAMSPRDSTKLISVPDDLSVDLVLSEPIIKQPLHLSFDSRGRLWVVQYIQYPDPAGLKRISRDKVWRVAYDRVPPPPPYPSGSPFIGKDKISIHEDTNGDGEFDKHKIFVDGLNMVTSVAHDGSGVWVTNPPYLLYYPDKNGDDVPDSDPVVHLEGFGLEDSHSIANSLSIGPDGWIYGAQGSTVSAAVTSPLSVGPKAAVKSMGQNVWRYHPENHVYEIFAEGGGNAFGLEIDSRGRVYSGHNGGNTRGFHYVLGGYYQKSWGKHGALTNDHAYGYFAAMKNAQVERFTHQFIIYEGNGLPKRYAGKLFGVDVLHNNLVLSDVFNDGSTFQTKDIRRVMSSKDPWFRPVMVTDSPDGSIYVADWYDRQVNHYRNHEGQIDHELGRVYRLRTKGKSPLSKKTNLTESSKVELLEASRSGSRWLRRSALVELRSRYKMAEITEIKRKQPTSATELELMLGSDNLIPIKDIEDVGLRGYAVRRLAAGVISERHRNDLIELASVEESPEVISQLIAVSKRMDSNDGFKIVKTVLSRDLFDSDPHIPLLTWWSIESKAASDVDAIKELFSDANIWRSKIFRDVVIGRVMRRFASQETVDGYLMCAFLLTKAVDQEVKKTLINGFSDALRGKQIGVMPRALLSQFEESKDLLPLTLRIRINSTGAVNEAIALLNKKETPTSSLIELISTLGFVQDDSAIFAIKSLLSEGSHKNVEIACLAALSAYCDEDEVKEIAFNKVKSSEAMIREAALDLLASELSAALFLVKRCKEGEFLLQTANASIHEKLRAHEDQSINGYLDKLLKNTDDKITDSQEREILRIKGIVSAAGGNPKNGEKTFTRLCIGCHKMFDNGGDIGPDLTSYQRNDVDALLMSLVAPAAEIREGYENVIIKTKSNTVHSGFLVEDTVKYAAIRELSGVSRIFERNKIKSLTSTGVSLMPQGLLNGIDDVALKDFFAYLRSTTPPF
ncbi:MAG: PVC-type heme-binding CxxCH protein [Verrucomicrobiales bacterium]